MSVTPGTRLGPYTIQSALGAGGMGEVYKARDMRLDRDVAIKILASSLAADVRFKERFEHEARVIASLNHPHICTLYDIGDRDGTTFLVMEYLDGETLAARLVRQRVPFETVLTWGIQVADALALAHAKGVVHRDLKPANIMLVRRGGLSHLDSARDALSDGRRASLPDAKVLDFGLAKTAELVAGTMTPTMVVTGSGTAVGTVAYMSPEQARGEPIDGRSDVFSLGAVLYEMATGRPAFTGATTAVIFDAIFNRRVRDVRELVPDVPAEFAWIVDRMLAKRPAERHPDASSVAAALRDLEGGRTSAPSGSEGVAPRAPSIAVLPFADMSPLQDQHYFCAGMAEELVNALSMLPGLRVASRTSASRFKGAEDIRKVGEQLGVETVLEGSVRAAGTRLRVTAQLTNVKDGYQLWSERYDRQVEDVFDTQDDIARAIVGALKVRLLGNEDAAIETRAAENLDAYRLCLNARDHWFKWTDEGFRTAMDLFEQALALDPEYPLAIFGLAECYLATSIVGVERDPNICESMLATAIRLDPELADAHAAIGLVKGWWTWRWAAAERSFETAMRISPGSPHVLQAYSMHLSLMGRSEAAIPLGKRGVEIDPQLPFWNAMLAQVYLHSRRYDDASRQANVALDLAPTFWWAHVCGGLSQAALGHQAEAVATLERAVTHAGAMPYALGWLGFVLAKAGQRDAAEVQLRTLLNRAESGYVPAVSVACVYAGLNDGERALDALDRAYAQKDVLLSWHLGPLFLFDDLRSDPRFADLVRRVGLEGGSSVAR